MSTRIRPSSRKQCPWAGCPAVFTDGLHHREHVAAEHVACQKCGRHFTFRGISIHRRVHDRDYPVISTPDETVAPIPETSKTDRQRIEAAITVAIRHGGLHGERRKAWVINEMLRKLCGDQFEKLTRAVRAGELDDNVYTWDEGTAP